VDSLDDTPAPASQRSVTAWLRRGLDENMRAAGLSPTAIGVFLLFGYFGLYSLAEGRGKVGFVVYCTGLWLLPWVYTGRAMSLRHDILALDVVPVADIFGEPVPTHPVWWRETAGRVPLWVPALVTIPWPSPPSSSRPGSPAS
jgi:hypothetical protein